MSLPYAAPKWYDGTYTVARPVGLPIFSAPIPATNTEYIMVQRWTQFRNNFTSLALNTAHPDYGTFKLVSEGPREDKSGGVIEWDRTYAKVPSFHFDPESFGYSFIGMTVTLGAGGYATRPRKSIPVPSRVRYDYFLVPSLGVVDPILGGAPYDINSDGDIKKILDMQYVSQGSVGGATYGGINITVDTLNVQGVVMPTYPTSEQYLAQIADAFTNGWNGTFTKIIVFPTTTLAGGPPYTSGHQAGVIDTANTVLGGIIPVEPSRLTRWNGNIFQRAVRYALAQ
jgi:hypothetical protein